MPAGNKMGPESQGPLTGKRMGSCSGNNVSGLAFSGGFGRGFGRSFRGGLGNYNYSESQYPTDKEALKNEISALKNQLSFLEKKLSETPDKD
jgi:hypothetical protein